MGRSFCLFIVMALSWIQFPVTAHAVWLDHDPSVPQAVKDYWMIDPNDGFSLQTPVEDFATLFGWSFDQDQLAGYANITDASEIMEFIQDPGAMFARIFPMLPEEDRNAIAYYFNSVVGFPDNSIYGYHYTNDPSKEGASISTFYGLFRGSYALATWTYVANEDEGAPVSGLMLFKQDPDGRPTFQITTWDSLGNVINRCTVNLQEELSPRDVQ